MAMRIVMLGWEFPPFISGGLGTACYGLTKALSQAGHEVLFVLPRPVDRSHATHIRLLSPEALAGIGVSPALATMAASSSPGSEVEGRDHGAGADPAETMAGGPGGIGTTAGAWGGGGGGWVGAGQLRVIGVPARFRSPYPGAAGGVGAGAARRRVVGKVPVRPDGSPLSAEELAELTDEELRAMGAELAGPMFGRTGAGAHYQGDLVAEAERYARLVVALARGERFDLVHAHDWLTFPAGQALSRVTGRPLVVHVHSTEFDRAGEHVNQRVYEIERRGMMSAMRVLCVSEYTRRLVLQRYGVPAEKVDVVYNGIDNERWQPGAASAIQRRDRIVLFLGRITMQKGPEYFINAARRVLEKVPEAKFIVAGSGDMELRMIELAANLGIGHRVLFTGFLRGPDVDRVFRMADCYVMPSVSEPFGLAPLEAIRNDVPVIISRQSGVSEVLSHCLKVDFWDVDDIANKIVAVLRHPPLGQLMREHGSVEIRRLTWEGAAKACVESYRRAIEGQRTAGLPARV
jgi:glycogen(starch) synthase